MSLFEDLKTETITTPTVRQSNIDNRSTIIVGLKVAHPAFWRMYFQKVS